jgi:hypothetical protein
MAQQLPPVSTTPIWIQNIGAFLVGANPTREFSRANESEIAKCVQEREQLDAETIRKQEKERAKMARAAPSEPTEDQGLLDVTRAKVD